MPKITFLGAGSTMFARRLIGDCMLTSCLRDSHVALYDIDPERLRQSKHVLDMMNRKINRGRARITGHLGVRSRRAALRGANYVINAVQVGGYQATRTDFETPLKYGLQQTIGDTLGIGGIFRCLRTAPVMLDFARDMEAVCPTAWLLNYTNPMAMLSGVVLRGSSIPYVGLCHSVQGCVRGLMIRLGMLKDAREEVPITRIGTADPGHRLQWKIAGINHQAWLLEVADNGKDLYPELRRRAAAAVRESLRGGKQCDNMVRYEVMRRFGYYVTESSVHSAEYMPYWIKNQFPDIAKRLNVPIGEYLRRVEQQQEDWKRHFREARSGKDMPKHRSHEFGSYIMEAMETDHAIRIHGNVLNTGLITNLPAKAVVEIPCLVDRNGVTGCHVGELPEVCAALNRTNINVQLLAVEAALTRKREAIYHAAFLDPHTASELPLDKIRALCDDLIKAHGSLLPRYI